MCPARLSAFGLQGQTLGDGGEFVAGLDFFGAEAGCEELANGGDEGRTAGEEDAVDGGGSDPGLLEELVDGAFDGFEVRGDSGGEAGVDVEIDFGMGCTWKPGCR